jgi:DNA-binding NarL/FixJ family response regulator
MSAMEYGGPERRRGGPDRRAAGELTRILIVDDHALFRVGIANILGREPDLDVVGEAEDSRSAVDRALETSPDIILMDLSLPVMDGWEATRRLKADKRTAQIPVVALTGHALAGISEGAKKAGCDAFVTKPCLPEDLVKEIKKILDAPGAANRKVRRSGKYAKSIG